MGWNPEADDPLGIGLKTRAQAHRQKYAMDRANDMIAWRNQNPGLGGFGPIQSMTGVEERNVIPDPNWDGFLQALYENTDRVADNSVGVKRGMFPRQSMLALEGGGPIRQTDRAWMDPRGSQDAVDRQTGTGKHYQTHEQFTRRFGR